MAQLDQFGYSVADSVRSSQLHQANAVTPTWSSRQGTASAVRAARYLALHCTAAPFATASTMFSPP